MSKKIIERNFENLNEMFNKKYLDLQILEKVMLRNAVRIYGKKNGSSHVINLESNDDNDAGWNIIAQRHAEPEFLFVKSIEVTVLDGITIIAEDKDEQEVKLEISDLMLGQAGCLADFIHEMYS